MPPASHAEDLTSETFLAAVGAIRSGAVDEPSIGWLIGIARHKLVDHWRRSEREERRLRVVASQPAAGDLAIDPGRGMEVLAGMNPFQRAALTLRHVDGLSVPEVARLLGRSTAATETLLARARACSASATARRRPSVPDVLDALRESGGSTEPDSVFRAELMGRGPGCARRPGRVGPGERVVPNSRRSTGHDRQRTSIVLAAAAFVAAAIAGIVWYGARRAGANQPPLRSTRRSATVPSRR